MERKTGSRLIPACLILLGMLLFSGTFVNEVHARQNHQDSIHEAYVHGRMHLWEQALKAMTDQYRHSPSDSLLYDILLAQYGLIGHYLEEDRDAEAEALLAEAEKYLTRLEKRPGFAVESMLFEAAFKAFRINLRPRRGISLGPQSSRLINQALDSDPSYPRAHLEKGNMLYHAPRLFGGSKKESIPHYAKAIALWEQELPKNQRWLYLSTLVSLAKAQKDTGDLDQAIATLEKALQFEAEFQWVRDELLPEFRDKR